MSPFTQARTSRTADETMNQGSIQAGARIGSTSIGWRVASRDTTLNDSNSIPPMAGGYLRTTNHHFLGSREASLDAPFIRSGQSSKTLACARIFGVGHRAGSLPACGD